MAVAVKKYNPGFLTDDEIIDSFCVRTAEFESIVESLREMGSSSSTHSLVIGPRGSGKTHLLLRVAAEVRRDPDLSGIFPVVFAEESYEVGTCGEFWLECLAHLADQAPQGERDGLRLSYQDLRTVSDDSALAERCLGSLLDFADRHDKRLLLVVENLNMLFSDMSDPDAGWQLRKTLQTEPRIILLGSATSRFHEIDSPEHALYDLFRALTLRSLDTAECEALWEAVSGNPSSSDTVRPLEILTGGSPRLISIIARFGADRSFADLMENLLDLVDEHTEYFKSHLEALPPQERRVYLALARLWKPATAGEVSDQSRIDVNRCSALLQRLVQRGVVAIEGGTTRRRQYYLTERLYNIYYLLRRGAGTDRLVTALIEFMICLYSPSELGDAIKGVVRDAHGSNILRNLPEQMAGALIGEAEDMKQVGRESDALEIYDRVIEGLGSDANVAKYSNLSVAFLNKSLLLVDMGQASEAILVCDDLLTRVDTPRDDFSLVVMGSALMSKGLALSQVDDLETALESCDLAIGSFGAVESPDSTKLMMAHAVYMKGLMLILSKRELDALSAFDQVVQLCEPDADFRLVRLAASALSRKATTLTPMGQTISDFEFSMLLRFIDEHEDLASVSIDGVVHYIVGAEPIHALELIQESPAVGKLLPLVIALQLELGQDSQVPKEVQEVAQDIRSKIASIRSTLESD